MIFKKIVVVLILAGLSSCADGPNVQASLVERSASGFSIENSQRSGVGYTSSNGTAYVCYYITTTITNDSTLPMRLVIDFSKEKKSAQDSLGPVVFLFPRKQMNPEVRGRALDQQIDLGEISGELKWFLDRVAEIPVSLDTVLTPKQNV